AAGFVSAKSDRTALRPAVEDARIAVFGRVFPFRIVPIISTSIDEPACTTRECNSLGKEARFVNVVTFVIHVNTNSPCGSSLRILVRTIGIIARFIEEQRCTQDSRALRPLSSDVLIVAGAI